MLTKYKFENAYKIKISTVLDMLYCFRSAYYIFQKGTYIISCSLGSVLSCLDPNTLYIIIGNIILLSNLKGLEGTTRYAGLLLAPA